MTHFFKYPTVTVHGLLCLPWFVVAVTLRYDKLADRRRSQKDDISQTYSLNSMGIGANDSIVVPAVSTQ